MVSRRIWKKPARILLAVFSVSILVVSILPRPAGAAAYENESFPMNVDAYCNDNAGPWWNPNADDQAHVRNDGKVYVKGPDSNYFYFRAVTTHTGKDADGHPHSYSPFNQVRGQTRADLYYHFVDHVSGNSADREVNADYTYDYVDIVYEGSENVDTVWSYYKSSRSDAGNWARLRTFCNISPDGAGGSPQVLRYWGIWLTKNDLTLTYPNSVIVRWDSYTDSGTFSKYQVYWKHYSSSTWNLGYTSYSRSTSSTTLGPFGCYTTYDFKLKLTFNGAQSWENSYSETYISTMYIHTCNL